MLLVERERERERDLKIPSDEITHVHYEDLEKINKK